MSYTKTTWSDGDIITANKMNNIETGVESLNTDIGRLQTDLDSLTETVENLPTGGGDVPADYQELVDDVSDLKADLNDMHIVKNMSGWEKGSFNSITGADYTESNYIRLKTNVGVSTGVNKITCDDGYVFMLFAWDSDGNFVGSLKTGKVFDKTTSNFLVISEFDCTLYPTYTYKTAMRMNPADASITADDGVHCYFYRFTDDSLTISGKAADAKAVGEEIKKVSNKVIKSVDTWYHMTIINTKDDIGTLQSTDTRLLTIGSITDLLNPVNAGDIAEVKLLNPGYSYAYSVVQKRSETELTLLDPWEYYYSDKIINITHDGYFVLMLRKNDNSNISVSDAENIHFKIGVDLPKYINDAISNSNKSKWSGKTAVFVGDSITYGVNTTEGHIYYQILSSMCEISAIGMGIGGSCYSKTSDYGTQNTPISMRWETIPEKDLICLFAGTNDYGHSTPMGTISDTTDVSFYGALRTVIGGLISKYPSSRLVVMTPLHRYNFGGLTYDTEANAEGNTLKDYVDAIKNVCELYSVPVIDTFNISGLNPMITSIYEAYVTDGLHPNAAGHELIAERVASLFENL